MKKLVLIITVLVLSIVLAGCEEKKVEVTPPTLTSFKIDESAAKVADEFEIFYKEKNEMVRVDMIISNPSNLEISSIVVNGYNYRTFEEGSNTRRVIFDLDVGSGTGPLVFSIDTIKYNDGDNLEESIITGNNEFEVYIYKDVPSIEREDYSLSQDSIYVEFNKIDIDNVIEEGTLRAELYSGENSIDSIVITDDMEFVMFTGLLTSNIFELRFVADYDLDGEDGIQEEVKLFTEEFSTLGKIIPNASITNIVVESNMVTFDVTHEDNDDVIVDGGLVVHIYDGETSIASRVITETYSQLTFDGLDNINNNHDYTIKVLADYDLADGMGVLEDGLLSVGSFSTPSKTVPLPQILDLSIEENLVSFDVEIQDPQMLLIEDSLTAHIYVDEVFIDSSPIVDNHVDFQIFNLFANELFEIRITASYDLNDGQGLYTDEIIFSDDYTTRGNEAPSVNVSTVTLRQGYVTLDLVVDDSYSTLKGDIVAVLKEDGNIVGTPILFNKEAVKIEFEYLVTYTSVYTVEITADYNLRDGNGTLLDQVLFSNVVITVEKKEPVAEIKNIMEANDSFAFNVRVMDADTTILPDSVFVYLYKDGVLDPDHNPIPVGFDSPLVTFTDLISNTEYKIVVKAIYDLEDGTIIFEPQTIFEGTYKTLEKSIPETSLENMESTNSTITVDIIIDDVDEVRVPGTVFAHLYKDGLPVGQSVELTLAVNPNVTFIDLLSNTMYSIVVMGNYDLNDGNEVVVDYTFTEGSISTIQKSSPVATIAVIEETQNSVTIDVELFDLDTVINGVARAELYIGDQLQQSIDLVVGLNSNVVFTGIQSDTRFNIKIVADFDLNDGNPPYVDAILNNEPTSSLVNILPEGLYLDSLLGKDTYTFSVEIFDEDDVIVPGTLLAVLYKDGSPEGQTITLSKGVNTDEVFTGLQADSVYSISIVTDYNLLDGTLDVEDYLLASFSATTEKLIKPVVVVVPKAIFNTELVFDIEVIDIDDTLSAAVTPYLMAELFKNGVTTTFTQALSVGLNEDVTFSGLEYGQSYEVRIIANYNLNDGNADTEDDQIGQGTAATVDIIYITNFLEEIRNEGVYPITDLSQVFVSFDIDVNDTFGVLQNPNLIFNLYKADHTPVGISQVFYSSFDMELLNLQFDNEYYFTVTGTVDLGAGASQQVIYTQHFTTTENVLPTVGVSYITINQQTISVDVSISDPNGTLRGDLIAELWEDGVSVKTISFDPLTATIDFDHRAAFDKEYRIEITANYNLGDGAGDIPGIMLYSKVVLAVEKKEPSAVITDIEPNNDQIVFKLEVLDIDDTVIPATAVVGLYDENDVFISSLPYISGVTQYTFATNIYESRTYTVKVTVDYDILDGSGPQLGLVVYQDEIATIATVMPDADTNNAIGNGDSITVDIDIIDPDVTITPASIFAYAYKNGVLHGAPVPLVNGANAGVVFPGLDGASEYVITIKAAYDLNDENGPLLDQIIGSVTVSTLTKSMAEATLTLIEEKNNEITVNVNIVDPDNVTTANLRVEIYKQDELKSSVLLSSGDNNVVFTGLEYGVNYLVYVYGDFDMNDGTGLILDHEFADDEYQTIALVISSNFVEDKLNAVSTPTATPAEVIVSLTLTVFDENTIMTSSEMIVELYTKSDDVLVGDTTVNGALGSVFFYNLLFNTEYYYTVKAMVDHGAGPVQEIVHTEEFTTSGIFIPVAEITDLIPGPTTITFNISDIVDDDSAITGNLEVVLIKDGVEGTPQSINLTGNGLITFNENGQDGSTYEIIVRATIDYRDGELPQDDQILTSISFIYGN